MSLFVNESLRSPIRYGYVSCRRDTEEKRGLSRINIYRISNLRSVLLSQLTALRDEQPTLREDCSLMLLNIPLGVPFIGGLFSIAFKTSIPVIVSLSAVYEPSLFRV